MKSILVTAPGELSVAEMPIPTLESPSHILVKIRAAGICGSDISIYKGTSPVATYPRVIGHEFAGEVVEIGADVTDLKVGDHVSVNPVMPCGSCRVCQKGRGNVCPTLKVIGVHVDGGFREYVSVPRQNAFAVSKSLPWNYAAVIEPYTVAAQVTSRGGVQAGDVVLILGAGQIALTILQVCKLLGASCVMTDVVDSRLVRAKALGAAEVINSATEDVIERIRALTGGIGADVAIDAACVGSTLAQAVQGVRQAGVVVTMGFADRAISATELQITSRELDIRGTRLNNHRFPQVIEWFESGALSPEPIITHQLHFTEVLKGMDLVKSDPENTLKVVLTFD